MEAIKNKTIVDLYNNAMFLNKLKMINKDNYEDLRSDVVEILLKKDAQYIIARSENKSLFATAIIIARNLNKKLLIKKKRYISNHQHNKKGSAIDVIDNLVSVPDEKDIFQYRSEAFNECFKELPFFSRFILDELLIHGTARRIAEENRFNYSGVLKALNVAKRQLQEIIQSKTEEIELSDELNIINHKYQFKNSLDTLNRVEVYSKLK